MSEVCQAIIDECQEVITIPDTAKGWREVDAQFGSRCNSPPHTIYRGPRWQTCEDQGHKKHCTTNTKGFSTLLFLTLVDSNYRCGVGLELMDLYTIYTILLLVTVLSSMSLL